MNEVAISHAVSAATLEHVLGTGDLSKLTTPQRVEYYRRTCESLGLNPLTRPFRFLALNGQIQLYATRDCTDQLRKVHSITLHVTDKQLDGELFIVTVRARDKTGREDEDIAAVTLGQLRGESRANALMKAMTKAKRRVTLSICGLGSPDESELDTMPGAQVFDAEAEPPAETPSFRPAVPNPPTVTYPVPEPSSRRTSSPRAAGPDPKSVAWKDRVVETLAQAQSEAAIDALRKKIASNYAACRTAWPDMAAEIDNAEREARERIRGVAGSGGWDTAEGADPIAELIAEVEAMDAAALDGLASNAAWRAKTRDLFPLDQDRLEDAIAARKAEVLEAERDRR